MTDLFGDTEDVSTVMTQVLNSMDRIVEHFRDKGENDAANNIAKYTISTVKVFNETIAPWDMATATMQCPSYSMPVQPPKSRALTTTQARPISAPQVTPAVTSWAAVAAVAPAAGNKLIKFTPNDTLQMRVPEVQATPLVAEIDSDMRVVWVRGWSLEKAMSEITDKVGQGPIYSMAYSEKDSAVCVIFQQAFSAKQLVADDQHFMKNNGHSRFGPGCDVVEGLSFPENDDIRRMSIPYNERRRLTFARSQLFTNGLTEERFKKDLYSIVGERNVELVWLFNTGNATVVLSAVPLARLVRSEFLKIARPHGSPYHDVVVTFSHDPCERPMTLITQMPNGRSLRVPSLYGCNGIMPAGVLTNGRAASRRSTVNDGDGWQTVNRRR